MREFKIGFSQSHLSLFVAKLKLKLQIWNWQYPCNTYGAKELFTLILKMLQIANIKTINNRLPTGSFDKIDDYTKWTQILKLCAFIAVYYTLGRR